MSFRFFFHAPPPPEIYTLSLHDALPIFPAGSAGADQGVVVVTGSDWAGVTAEPAPPLPPPDGADEGDEGDDGDGDEGRSEEHTSELQSRLHLVCRLLLEKKKNNELELTR